MSTDSSAPASGRPPRRAIVTLGVLGLCAGLPGTASATGRPGVRPTPVQNTGTSPCPAPVPKPVPVHAPGGDPFALDGSTRNLPSRGAADAATALADQRRNPTGSQ